MVMKTTDLLLKATLIYSALVLTNFNTNAQQSTVTGINQSKTKYEKKKVQDVSEKANKNQITYNYATKEWSTISKVKIGEPVVFSITNVDSNLDVSINGRNIEVKPESSSGNKIQSIDPKLKSYSISKIANQDYLEFTYKIIEGEDVKEMDTITVPIYGGWKINMSQGLGFVINPNKSTDFSLKDSTIIGSANGRFNPSLFTFIHAHRRSASSFSYGLSVGIGYGFANQDLQFAFGPSFIIGKQKRLIVTGGVAAYKTNKLKAGYKEGDKIKLTDVPKEQSYDLGLFFGVSFNLSDLNLGDIIKKGK
jgi:hypothetical protein